MWSLFCRCSRLPSLFHLNGISCLFPIWMIAIIALSACTSENVAGGAGAGNPPQAQVSLSLKAGLSAPVLVKKAYSINNDETPEVIDSLGSKVTLTSIEARIESIEFHFHEAFECTSVHDLTCDGDKIALEQPRDVQMLTGLVTPAIEPFYLPAGAYPRLRLQFSSSNSGHSNSTSETFNVWIRGIVTTAGQTDRTFEFSLSLNDGMDFESPEGIEFKANSTNALQLLWQVNHWFDEVDMAKCLSTSTPPGGDGVAHLDGDNACDGAGKRIRQQIESSGRAENSQ